MVKIFISYCRADSQHVTDSVYAHMARRFSQENVSLDVNSSIPPGIDFRTYLNDQVAAHDVVLVIIGPDWGRIMQERAGQEDDLTRIEIESALQQGKLVITVLVKNAEMPDFSQLPQSINDLQWRNTVVIRQQPDLENDCIQLADSIQQYMAIIGFSTRPSTKDILPAPFDWVEIPGGSGTMKTDSINVTLQIPTETYWMGKYPVTNAQFAKFIEAGGYTNPKWWTEEGWQRCQEGWHWNSNTEEFELSDTPWKQPFFWDDSKWNGAEYPVVGVSWFEAVAFCLWVSDITNEKIMLPTEAQWQYAAQGTDGRDYPWGNEFDKNRCNSHESGIGETTPVTHYANKGDSPFGVVDMAGNIFEWCLTDYNNLTNALDEKTTRRVLRGGAWCLFHRITRAAYRSFYNPFFRGVSYGFRCVRSL